MIVICIAAIACIALALLALNSEKPKDKKQEFGAGGIDRISYGIPESVFSELPKTPEDFNNVIELFYDGKINSGYLSKPYYKQPEFLRSFNESGLKHWTMPEEDRWIASGFGIMPMSQAIHVNKAGKARARIFVHCSFGARSFQGLKARVEMPENTLDFLAIEPLEKNILLEPCFPKFGNEWIQAIDFTIKASENSEEGIFEAGIAFENPDEEKMKEWSERYGSMYFNALSFGGLNENAKIIVKVN